MNILYSFNKRGYEAGYWQREIAAASDADYRFVPFNHDRHLPPRLYLRAQLLDNLYFARHPGLMKLYAELVETIRSLRIDALVVDNCFPYHPDFLRTLPVYKVIRTTDGPITAYERDIPYLHAYDHVLYHSPAYSRDMGMAEKLAYCGAKRADFLPLGLFDAAFDPDKTAETILAGPRDIAVVFIGALHVSKMPLLARVRKALGRRCLFRGVSTWKQNAYFNARFGFPGWVRPVAFSEYVPIYQRSRIGFNVHNRGDYTVGGYRFFDLPGNGVMQISDGGEYLGRFFAPGEEVVGYRDADDLIDKIRHYLDHDAERERIALNGYRRVVRDYRFGRIMRRAGELIAEGMSRSGVSDPPRNAGPT